MRRLTSEARTGQLLAALAAAIVIASVAFAQDGAPEVVALTPDEMKWQSQGGLTLPGLERLNRRRSAVAARPAEPNPCDE